MKPINGNRVGHREHGNGGGRSDAQADDPVTPLVMAALDGMTKWNAALIHDLSDSSVVRLQTALERALRPLVPSPDGRIGGTATK